MLFSAHPVPHAAAALAGLNALDWALIAIVGVSTLTAFLRGLVRSVIALLGVVLGILLAAWYAPDFAAVLHVWIPPPVLAAASAFLLILAGTYLIAALLGRVLGGAAKAVGLGFLDRIGGALFGFGRAVLFLAAVLVPFKTFFTRIPMSRDSTLLPYLQTASHGVSFVMPQDFGKRLLAGAGSRTASPVPRSNAVQTTDEGEAQ